MKTHGNTSIVALRSPNDYLNMEGSNRVRQTFILVGEALIRPEVSFYKTLPYPIEMEYSVESHDDTLFIHSISLHHEEY